MPPAAASTPGPAGTYLCTLPAPFPATDTAWLDCLSPPRTCSPRLQLLQPVASNRCWSAHAVLNTQAPKKEVLEREAEDIRLTQLCAFCHRQLPGWVRESLVPASRYGDAHGRLVRFFRGMAQQ